MSTCVALLERVPSVEVVVDSDLGAVLDGLGICPFTSESVETYKQRIAKEANRFLWFHRLLGLIENIASRNIFLMVIISGVIIKHRGSWSSVLFDEYREVIPEFALLHAMEIQANLPDAELFVHQFVQDRKVLDPFLSVQRNGEEHFIDV